jgi:chloride channel 7
MLDECTLETNCVYSFELFFTQESHRAIFVPFVPSCLLSEKARFSVCDQANKAAGAIMARPPASYHDLPVDEEDDVMVNRGSAAHSRSRGSDALSQLNGSGTHDNGLMIHSHNGGGGAGTPYYHDKTPSLRGDGYGGGGQQRSSATRMMGSNNHNSSIPSHNYEPDESEVWRAHTAHVHFRNRGQWWTTGKKRALQRWVLTFIIGVLQAFVATGCNFLTRSLSSHKYTRVYELLLWRGVPNSHAASATMNGLDDSSGDDLPLWQMDDDQTTLTSHNMINSASSSSSSSSSTNGSSLLTAYLWFVLYQVTFAAIASLFVWLEPVAAGSGIPEVKCFLNGIDLPRVVRVRTLLCKVLGVSFSVAAGLPVGKEGPMVHTGAVVAAGVSQGKSRWLGFDTSFTKFSDFRNDREKRDFVACGAAAGVCSAFGAPLGGVLFVLEDASSYFSTKLTWRAFFCAMSTLATLFWLRNFDSYWGQANMDKLFSFGDFNSATSGEESNFAIWELLLFVIIGSLGGLIGAVFNAANEHMTLWRMKRINHSKLRRFLEVILISFLVSTVSFVMPLIWGHCTELPTNVQAWTKQEKNLVDALVPFRCVPGKEYNEVASLIFTDANTAIKQLFHFREAGGDDDSATFSSAALFLFFVPYITMASIVYGIAVPSGLFVPTLLSGAAFGRLVGHLLHQLDHTSGTFADSGTYALIGAAAVLGGMARMTISLTVILLEATGDMQYVLPLMLTLMSARFTGNVFNEGLYDIHIKLQNIPFLDPDVPPIAERNEIVAGQVMSTEVKCLRPVERAGVVYDLLRSCGHGTFPVVDTVSGGTLYGTASRHMLCTLLQRRAFGSADLDGDHLGPRRLSPLVQWETIERAYPRYPTIEDVDVLCETDRNCWVDLRPYANTAPYTVNETASIQRTYRLFRTLGLKFLCVVNHKNQVVGIITRRDLLPEALTDSLLRGRNAHVHG